MLPIATTNYFAQRRDDGGLIGSIAGGAGSLVTFFTSPWIGQASDRYGRKAFIMFSQIVRLGYPASFIYFILLNGSIWPFYTMQFVNAALAIMGVACASIADVVAPKDRAATFGILYAAFAVGFCSGAGISPLFSHTHVLIISTALYCLRAIWAVAVIQETLADDQRRVSSHVFENPVHGIAILFRSKLFTRLTALIALTSFVANGIFQIRLFYLNGSIIAQSLLLKLLMDCIQERGVIVVALLGRILECGSYAATAFYPHKWIVFAAMIPSSIGDLSFAAIASLKSINCSVQEQGRLQGAIYGARAIFEAAGPIVYAAMYSAMLHDTSHATPFVLSMVLYVLGISIACILPASKTSRTESIDHDEKVVRAAPSTADFALAEPLLDDPKVEVLI
ncbi:TPA: hypothetical protein N0F65_008561 [Lagenidium giganteum]|uniref:Major facilitator superfamily (MFS) profile domain-containing protein n=1 Tax=Lagenidium giganteum TaxID=4803 RepID=A0AAV2YF44_9STRA|nr:TPA: hypothetical protein N0F65_008561 [Lagenidium giganteum]